jgi:hypothetical protein
MGDVPTAASAATLLAAASAAPLCTPPPLLPAAAAPGTADPRTAAPPVVAPSKTAPPRSGTVGRERRGSRETLAPPPPTTATTTAGTGAPLLLRSAASGSDSTISTIYEQMGKLVGPSAPSAQRRVFLDELETGASCSEPVDFFHVAIDLPGYGFSKASLLHHKRKADDPLVPASFLSDIISARQRRSNQGRATRS